MLFTSNNLLTWMYLKYISTLIYLNVLFYIRKILIWMQNCNKLTYYPEAWLYIWKLTGICKHTSESLPTKNSNFSLQNILNWMCRIRSESFLTWMCNSQSKVLLTAYLCRVSTWTVQYSRTRVQTLPWWWVLCEFFPSIYLFAGQCTLIVHIAVCNTQSMRCAHCCTMKSGSWFCSIGNDIITDPYILLKYCITHDFCSRTQWRHARTKANCYEHSHYSHMVHAENI